VAVFTVRAGQGEVREGWRRSGKVLALGWVLLVAGLLSTTSPAGAGDGVSSTNDAATGTAADLAGANDHDGHVGWTSGAEVLRASPMRNLLT
jgi:hypothetical protein